MVKSDLFSFSFTVRPRISFLINDNNFRVSIRVGEEMVLGLFVPTHGVRGKLDGIRKTAIRKCY